MGHKLDHTLFRHTSGVISGLGRCTTHTAGEEFRFYVYMGFVCGNLRITAAIRSVLAVSVKVTQNKQIFFGFDSIASVLSISES